MFQKLVKIVPGGVHWNALEKIPRIYEKLVNSLFTATSGKKVSRKGLWIFFFCVCVCVHVGC